MSATTSLSVLVIVLLAGAGLSLYDLTTDERRTVVVYTTPALRDLLERNIVPRFEAETGIEVSLVYVPAGQQYNRLRMGGDHAEADLFLHASPLYLEKGYAEAHVDPAVVPGIDVDDTLAGRPVEGGRAWHAFAWSPLVEVFPEGADVSDLATSDGSFGFPHPLLSNNGIYVVLLFEEASPQAGARALQHTRSQPTNARANIGGVADGSFAHTLGYEAVVKFFQQQGARIDYAVPLIEGKEITTPVLFSVALIHGNRHPRAEDLMRFLFTNESQDALSSFHFRSVRADPSENAKFADIENARTIHYDWSRWAELESTLPKYQR